MNSAWKTIESTTDLDFAFQESFERPVLLFKHSTRCSISSMAMSRLQGLSQAILKATAIYYLDLIAFRELSSTIAERTGIRHESPQVLIIQDAKCRYHASHMQISAAGIEGELV